MEKRHCYYIECTFDDNGEKWQRWSDETFLSFVKIKNEVSKLSQQELEYNAITDDNLLVPKIRGFRIVSEVIETKTEVISEYLFT